MKPAALLPIPHERQDDPRGCGAAALCMVYRSLGLDESQAAIWQRIVRPGPWGRPRTNTYLLAADALDRGLAAVVFQARHPEAVLERAASAEVRVILNHRASSSSEAGHFTVLAGLDREHVYLHDPARGPGRRLPRGEFLELWGPRFGRSEITGNVLAAFARVRSEPVRCATCNGTIPETSTCRGCRRAMPLRPAEPLGCVADDCPGRMWERVFCPYCDLSAFSVDLVDAVDQVDTLKGPEEIPL